MLLRLAAGETITAAARTEKVSRQHVYKLLEDPQAQREILEIRARMTRLTVGKLVKVSTKAVDKLAGLLEAESEQVQLGAARAILAMTPDWIDTVDLDIRLTALEAGQARRDRSNGSHH